LMKSTNGTRGPSLSLQTAWMTDGLLHPAKIPRTASFTVVPQRAADAMTCLNRSP
jgi:hypothetical protein